MLLSGIRVRQQLLRPITLVALLITALGVSAWAQTTPAPRKNKAKLADKSQLEQVSTPASPTPPPTPEHMPARPPTVSYQNGQLSIVAPNSTLSDILLAVKSKTGASIEIPPGANERVVSRFGPGPARDVLAALLNGTHFNYVMIGSDANPTSVAQVILTPRTGGETPPVTQAGAQPNPGMPQYPGQVMQPQAYVGGQPVYQQVPPPQTEEAPPAESEEDDSAAQQQQDVNGDENADPNNQGNDGQENGQQQVKTPEQLLQELQRQQQMQQQQQQGQQPVQPPASPPQ